jgi:hypothetical protein
LAVAAPFASQADQVIVDDLIVVGSECLGYDCDLDEEFGFSYTLGRADD